MTVKYRLSNNRENFRDTEAVGADALKLPGRKECGRDQRDSEKVKLESSIYITVDTLK